MANDTPPPHQPAGYIPPKVWTWNPANGGQFASINRPVSGATYDRQLSAGRHLLQLYSLSTPIEQKVPILLKELLLSGHADAECDAWLIEIGKGDQFGSGFVEINPNPKFRCSPITAQTRRSGCLRADRGTRGRPARTHHQSRERGAGHILARTPRGRSGQSPERPDNFCLSRRQNRAAPCSAYWPACPLR